MTSSSFPTFSFSLVSLITRWLVKGIGVSHAQYENHHPKPEPITLRTARTTYATAYAKLNFTKYLKMRDLLKRCVKKY